MIANSYLEYAMLLFGWVISNQIWNMLSETGIFILPLIFKVVSVVISVREAGAAEGNKGLQTMSMIENKIYISMLVILFACIPTVPANLKIMQYNTDDSKKCGYSVAKIDDSQFSHSINEIDGHRAELPLWWAFVHVISKGATQASVAAIPCKPDLRLLRFEMQHTQINDPILMQEIGEFIKMCYSPSYVKLKKTHREMSKETIEDTSWPGSSFFLQTPGYYDTYYSKVPREAWPYDADRDSGLFNANGAGYPTCRQWWRDKGRGLKDRMLAYADPSIWQRFKSTFTSKASHDEEMIRAMLTPRQNASDIGTAYQGYGGSAPNASIVGKIKSAVTGALSNMGGFIFRGVSAPMFDSLRNGLPMVQGVMLMALIISLPFVLVLSAYDLKIVSLLSVVFFGMFFLTFWWELARWIDSNFLDMIYGAEGYKAARNSNDDNIFVIINGVMFFMLPSFFVASLGWAGFKAGDAISSAVDKGGSAAQKPGQKGGDIASSAISGGRIGTASRMGGKQLTSAQYQNAKRIVRKEPMGESWRNNT